MVLAVPVVAMEFAKKGRNTGALHVWMMIRPVKCHAEQALVRRIAEKERFVFPVKNVRLLRSAQQSLGNVYRIPIVRRVKIVLMFASANV